MPLYKSNCKIIKLRKVILIKEIFQFVCVGVTILAVELESFVQFSSRVRLEDGKFFCRAKISRSCPRLL